MSYIARNYTEQGGAVTHIGGTLVIEEGAVTRIGGKLVVEEGAEIEGIPGMTQADHQSDSTATTVAALKEDLNALLSKLKAAGIMVADT